MTSDKSYRHGYRRTKDMIFAGHDRHDIEHPLVYSRRFDDDYLQGIAQAMRDYICQHCKGRGFLSTDCSYGGIRGGPGCGHCVKANDKAPHSLTIRKEMQP